MYLLKVVESCFKRTDFTSSTQSSKLTRYCAQVFDCVPLFFCHLCLRFSVLGASFPSASESVLTALALKSFSIESRLVFSTLRVFEDLDIG